MLGLRFCARAFSSCGERGPLFIAVHGPLTIVASLVAEHRLQTRRLSSCGSRAQLLRGMWDLPRPGFEPVSSALAGRLSTTAPSGKPPGKPQGSPPKEPFLKSGRSPWLREWRLCGPLSLFWAGLSFSSLLLFWSICPQGMNFSCSAWGPFISCLTPNCSKELDVVNRNLANSVCFNSSVSHCSCMSQQTFRLSNICSFHLPVSFLPPLWCPSSLPPSL